MVRWFQVEVVGDAFNNLLSVKIRRDTFVTTEVALGCTWAAQPGEQADETETVEDGMKQCLKALPERL
jgi:hypothetical protein